MTRALLIALAAIATFAGWQTLRLAWAENDRAALETRADNAEARLRAETARVALLRVEMESDREIDAIPDAGLADAVDPRWMRPTPAPR